MRYTQFGNTGIRVSKLGFGAMRLPMRSINGKDVVDEDKAVPLLLEAFSQGVNYVDTAPSYCNGYSEIAVGKALKEWRGSKVYLSTKNPVSNDSYDDFMKRLEDSLKKLDVACIDFYHLWGINWKQYCEVIDVAGGPIDAIHRAKEEGLIRHISFSFHDESEYMKKLVDTGHFESVLCQYNLLDRANEEALSYARKKGLGTVVMGPVAGGRLGAPSEVIQNLLGHRSASTAEMALRFVVANEDVSIALSGMENLAMLKENVAVASLEGALTGEELAQIKRMLDENKKLADLYCTGCNYCQPCPKGVGIAKIFQFMNLYRVYGVKEYAKGQYQAMRERKKENEQDASYCISCGQCEKKCPQKIAIMKQLQECDKILGS